MKPFYALPVMAAAHYGGLTSLPEVSAHLTESLSLLDKMYISLLYLNCKKNNQSKTMVPFTSKALFHFSYLQKAEAIPGRSTNFLQHILDILALVLNIRVEQVLLKIFKIPEYFFNG